MKTRARRKQDLFLQSINPIIKLMILSDVLIVGAAGMLAPLFALFIEDFIVGGDALVVSVAMSCFLLSRSLLQIPVATFIDRVKGEKDDYLFLLIFSFLSAALPLLYLLITTPLQLYLVQILLGLASAASYPSYMAIFTRHVDAHKEGTEWGIYYTMTDLGSAALAIIGGYIAEFFGFRSLILTVSILSILGTAFLIPIRLGLKKRS